jgi:hypothetical protein
MCGLPISISHCRGVARLMAPTIQLAPIHSNSLRQSFQPLRYRLLPSSRPGEGEAVPDLSHRSLPRPHLEDIRGLRTPAAAQRLAQTFAKCGHQVFCIRFPRARPHQHHLPNKRGPRQSIQIASPPSPESSFIPYAGCRILPLDPGKTLRVC